MNTETKHDGYKSLTLRIIEEAVEDVKMLTKKGIIKNGKYWGGAWPEKSEGVPMKYGGYFTKRFQVEELIYFFNSDALDNLIELSGFGVDSASIRSKLGI